MNKRYLTKSRFKLGAECPAKLFYTSKPDEYANQQLDDSFLSALADGGFQVGELAKLYYPEGHDITTLDHEEALAQTNRLLKEEDVIIYEAAIRFEQLFIRVDVLKKEGNKISLIEVKAKSIDVSQVEPFINKRSKKVTVKWRPYIEDAAFQKYVLSKALPKFQISASLMLVDRNAVCHVDGLNQKFKLTRNTAGRTSVSVSQVITMEDLAHPILCTINVDHECSMIFQEQTIINDHHYSFAEKVALFEDSYTKDIKIISPVSEACGHCEFRTTKGNEENNLKSGLQECWVKQLGWQENDFDEQTVFEIWNFRKKKKFIEEKAIKVTAVCEEDINPSSDNKAGISVSERQWLQVKKAQDKDESIWFDAENIASEMKSWTYPLHFIDFETSAPAIPFNKGMHPYEGLAFQFSHHVVYEDGKVEHYGEFLSTDCGKFPNYEFLRCLKAELEQDAGTIFRYSNHENTYLNMIFEQLKADVNDIEDRDELCSFIKSITKSTGKSSEKWAGERNMVDLWELVKRFYYDPATQGSNSIKAVLPAILNSSDFLKNKYSKPIYGAENGIQSLNFNDWQWVQFEGGMVKDPYALLPKLFQDVSDKDMSLLSEGDDMLSNGGAAMTAYARMQFEEMSDYERDEIKKALLKYCELDTLAMVMIYEGWKDMLENC